MDLKLWVWLPEPVNFKRMTMQIFFGVISILLLLIGIRYLKLNMLSRIGIKTTLSTNITSIWVFTIVGLLLVLAGCFLRIYDLVGSQDFLKVGVTITIFNIILVYIDIYKSKMNSKLSWVLFVTIFYGIGIFIYLKKRNELHHT